MTNTIPEPLFVFEMANNHMGDVEHGIYIIREFKEIAKDFGFRFAFKLQYRQLDTFIHPDFRNRFDVKHIKRFRETRLSEAEFLTLLDEIKRCGFLAMCTPFDEMSVDLIERHDFDILKIGSCSITDWPLLERIVQANKPVIASTAAVPLEDLDKVVSFFSHRGKDLALMHCVAEYPTPESRFQLNQIDLLKNRYPQLRIGHSTHENPDVVDGVKLAVAKGASIFEKHVGVPTEAWPLNDYSATPVQAAAWLQAARQAYEMCGVAGQRSVPAPLEIESLHNLRRGAFAKIPIKAGEAIDSEQVFMAFPPRSNQFTANDWSKYAHFVALADIAPGAPLLASVVQRSDSREQVYEIVQQVKRLLREGHVIAPGVAELEISHHYGLERFVEYGLTLINVVNREYCKKLLVMLPGQTHPEQYHKQKEETFVVLHGEMRLWLDDQPRDCQPGDVVTVGRGVRHRFYTERGVVFEEISSTHYKDDSYYADPAIAANRHRKTHLCYWL
jgi:sialic acid synthase SpsE/mannose-6-phosphate isomerase-like protein (cupin superfamily)